MKHNLAAPGLALLAACAMVAAPLDAQVIAPQTITELRAHAEAGDVPSQYLLGEAFRTGKGVTADREQAIVWFRRAYLRGDVRAADALGLLLFTKGERRESIPLLQAAAGRGDARALYILGTAHFNGDGVTRSVPLAYAEMRKAAATGLPQAVRSLAIMEPFVTETDRAASAAVRIGPDQPAAVAGAPASPGLPSPAVAAPQPPGPPRALPPAPLPVRPVTPPETMVQPLAAPPALVPPPAARPVPPAIRIVDLPPSTPPASRAYPEHVSGRWRVQLGALGTQEKAEEQWRLLVRRVPALADLPHTTQPAGTLWRLQAGGLADRQAAAETCRTVTDKGQPCIVLAP